MSHKDELPLGIVLDQLRTMLGPTSWLANTFLKKVEASDTVGTFAISGDGTMYYCPKFKSKYITSPERLQEVLLHEILHKVYGDFLRKPDYWTNLGADVVINWTVYRLLGHCDLMKSFYKDDKSEQAFLCPKFESPYLTPLSKMWTILSNCGSIDMEISNQEVIDALKSYFDKPNKGKRKKKPTLLGDHGSMEGSDNAKTSTPAENKDSAENKDILISEISNEDMSNIAKDLDKARANGGKMVGLGGVLENLLLKAIKTRLSLRSRVFNDFAIDNNMGKVKSYFTTVRRVTSVFPLNPSRSNLFMVACGYCPTLWRNEVPCQGTQNKGIAVYVDVSGSMWNDMPRICGLLGNMTSMLKSIYQFSTEVHKSSVKELAEGKVRGTGGTNFDCIAHSVIQNNEKKIVIITDGYADIDNDLGKKLKPILKKALVIYNDDCHHKGNWFSKNYHSDILLKDCLR